MPENNADSANNNNSTQQTKASLDSHQSPHNGITPPRPTPNRPTRQPQSPPPSSSGTHKHRRIPHPPHKKHPEPSNKTKNPRLILWAKIIVISFLVISIGITIRAMVTINAEHKGSSWMQELQKGNIDSAAKKFFMLTSNAVDHVFESELSPEALIADFKAALPHLSKAGYVLTELEIEVGISPKLIPHFYHDPTVKVDLDKVLASLKGNNIGTALMVSLAQASKLQKKVEISHMQFNHIEVELGPIPSLKLQYKNDHAIKDYIHQK